MYQVSSCTEFLLNNFTQGNNREKRLFGESRKCLACLYFVTFLATLHLPI